MVKNVVVVGAGLAGIQTAWFLLREGHNVTVIEHRDGIALETSFANGGLITPSHAAPWNSPGILRTLLSSIGNESSAIYVKFSALPQYLTWGMQFVRNSTPGRFRRTIQRNACLANYSLDQKNTLISELGLQFDGAARGTMMVYRSTAALERAKAANAIVENAGVDVQLCSPAELIKLEPALASVGDKLSGGFYYRGDQHGDAHLFCRALGQKAAEQGARMRFGETVQRIERSGNSIRAVVTDKQRYEADAVVLAAGLWSKALGQDLGLRLPIAPVKGYSVTYDVTGWEGQPKIPIVDDELHIGLTPLGNRMRFVGTAEFSGFSPQINPVRIDNLRRAALQIYPDVRPIIENAEPQSTWCGHRPMTPDCLPIVGQGGPENLYLNTGHGYLGWTTACGTSKAVSDLIAGRKPEIDVADYSLARF